MDTAPSAEISQSLEEPAYWQQYNLKADPFGLHESEDEIYQALPAWEQRIDLLHHLLHNCNVLLAVASDDNELRDAFKKHFFDGLHDGKCLLCKVSNPDLLTPASLPSFLPNISTSRSIRLWP